MRRTRLAAGLLLLLLPRAAHAEPRAPAAPQPAPTAGAIERMAEGTARARSFYLKPETERAAGESEAKMEAIQRKIDARVQRATRSICAGCTDAPASRRQRLAAPRIDEPVVDDPAQAPIE